MGGITVTPDWSGITNKPANVPAVDGGQVSGMNAFYVRAWANFNGAGTVSIRASGNISSVTRLSTGIFQINFMNAMPDINYAVVGMGRLQNFVTNSGWNVSVSMTDANVGGMNTGSVRVTTTNSLANESDSPYIGVAILR